MATIADRHVNGGDIRASLCRARRGGQRCSLLLHHHLSQVRVDTCHRLRSYAHVFRELQLHLRARAQDSYCVLMFQPTRGLRAQFNLRRFVRHGMKMKSTALNISETKQASRNKQLYLLSIDFHAGNEI